MLLPAAAKYPEVDLRGAEMNCQEARALTHGLTELLDRLASNIKKYKRLFDEGRADQHWH